MNNITDDYLKQTPSKLLFTHEYSIYFVYDDNYYLEIVTNDMKIMATYKIIGCHDTETGKIYWGHELNLYDKRIIMTDVLECYNTLKKKYDIDHDSYFNGAAIDESLLFNIVTGIVLMRNKSFITFKDKNVTTYFMICDIVKENKI
jgi:hypothetical protein